MKRLRIALVAIILLAVIGLLALGWLVVSTPTTRAEWVTDCTKRGGNEADCAAQWNEAYPGAQP
jgi:hypothetical protein